MVCLIDFLLVFDAYLLMCSRHRAVTAGLLGAAGAGAASG